MCCLGVSGRLETKWNKGPFLGTAQSRSEQKIVSHKGSVAAPWLVGSFPSKIISLADLVYSQKDVDTLKSGSLPPLDEKYTTFQ